MRLVLKRPQYVFPVCLILIWQLLCFAGFFSTGKIPSPFEILAAVKELFVFGLPQGKTLIMHCLYSLLRVGLGFLLSALIGIPLGILCGWSKILRELFNPVIEIIRPIPPLAWIPLAILWFGIGLQSATFIIFLGCLFPIILSTISGVVSVDAIFINAAKTLGATERQIFFKILLPGSLPSIYTGLRIGLGIGWMTLVAAEFTGVKSGYGLGYMIMTARDIQRPDLVIAGMAVIGFTGFLLDAILRQMQARALTWR